MNAIRETTPSTQAVRLAYRYGSRAPGRTLAEAEAEFDRWLEKIKSEARVEAIMGRGIVLPEKEQP